MPSNICRLSPGRSLFGSALLLFGGFAPRLFAAEAPAEHRVRIVLVGDSTVTDHAGWGAGFQRFVAPAAECINTAMGGRSSKSFRDEGRWEPALALKGDYYLIQFGHNDEPGKGPKRETIPDTTYTANMTRYVKDCRAIGAKPILVTSLVRRHFAADGSGKIDSSLEPYVAAIKRIAAQLDVPLIDLHALSKELCERLGPKACEEFSPLKPKGDVDTTHLNPKGSVLFGGLVVQELRRIAPELSPVLRAEPGPEKKSLPKIEEHDDKANPGEKTPAPRT